MKAWVVPAGLLALTVALLQQAPGQQPPIPADYRDLMATLGLNGDFADGVLKVTVNRTDLAVVVAGKRIPAAFGLGGWLSFTRIERGLDVMMGDLPLLEDEVGPVISALLSNGLEATALHNHFFREDPRIMFLHVHGMGTVGSLARQVKPVLDLLGRVRPGDPPQYRPPLALPRGNLNVDRLNRIIGFAGSVAPPVYKVVVGRTDLEVRDMGALINARMGLSSWAAVFGTDDSALVAGDVAMLEDEVTPVVNALRTNGLEVTAIHHHMTGSRPVIIFLHFWGAGPAEALARGFRAALDELGKH